MKKLAFILGCMALVSTVYAQVLWTDVAESSIPNQGERQIVPQVYRTVQLDTLQLKAVLSNITTNGGTQMLELPLPYGSTQRFSITKSKTLSPELAAKYPDITTYKGQGVDNKAATASLDYTLKGFHAMLLLPDGTVFIDPYHSATKTHYICYFKKDFTAPADKQQLPEDVTLEPTSQKKKNVIVGSGNGNDNKNPNKKRSTGGELREYRMAISTTGEYSTFHGGTIPLTLSAIATTLNRVNSIYEQEIAVTMVLVANNDSIIFLDPNADPFTNGTTSTLINENQVVIDSLIGDANYDIGHNFSTSGGGLAQVGAPCKGGSKARGVTGLPSPVGDPFDVEYVCHELGHQFSARHSFNGDAGSCGSNRTGNSAYEPGSGSTIMSYSGLCSPQNLQTASDAYFSRGSLDQMVNYTTNDDGDNCPTKTPINNNPPGIDTVIGDGYTIPVSTPFLLWGSAHDIDGDALTYCWEEFDLGPAGNPNAPVDNAPLFRSFSPVPDSFRIFPKLSDIVNNTQTFGELLPPYGRDLTFRMTVRDNRSGGACISDRQVDIDVEGTAGPFEVLLPNSNSFWTEGTMQTVTWDVANTDVNPVNCQLVNILFSSDGGWTYPITLATATPNDGAEMVMIPNLPGTTNRIKVEAADNIFFDITNDNFTIVSDTVVDFRFTVAPEKVIVCDEDSIAFTIELLPLGVFNDSVNLTLSGVPATTTADFGNGLDSLLAAPASITTLTFSNLIATGYGNYPITLTATADTLMYTQALRIVVPGTPDTLPGNAMFFDGASDQVTMVGAAPEGDAFTIEWWHYPRSHAGSNQKVGPGWGKFLFHTTDDGGLYVGTGSTARFTEADDLPPGTLELNKWQHFAFTFDGGESKFYKNGVLLAEKAFMPDPVNWEDFQLGEFSANTIDGRIDELRIWEVARTQAELRESMHLTLPKCTPGLTSYYQFNEASGDALDIVSSYDGSVVNAFRKPASEPIGPGAVHTATEQNGPVSFPGTGFTPDFAQQDGATIVTTKIDLSPNTNFGTGPGEAMFDSQYWVAHRYEPDAGPFDATVTFQVDEDITPADESLPLVLLLYGRESNSDTTWHLVNNANGADATNDAVSFDAISQFEQYLIARTTNPVISVEQLEDFCLTTVGEVSNVLSYEVEGVLLTDNIYLFPSEGFEVSLNASSGFVGAGDSLELVQSGGVVLPTDIFVRFTPQTDSAYTGNVLHASNGAVSRVVNVSGKSASPLSGMALELDGSGDRVRVAPLNLYSNTVTMSAWIKPDSVQNAWSGILFSRGGNTTAGISVADSMEFRYHWNNGGWPWSSGLYVPTDVWSYVAFVVTPDSATLYVNGVSSTHVTTLDPEEFNGNFTIGRDTYSNSRTFRGLIDEARVWNRALTAQEIREHMHLTLSGCQDDLAMYFQFNEDTTATWARNMGSGADGELLGNPQWVPASEPLGTGVANTQTEQNGGLTYTDTEVYMDYSSQDGAEVVVSKINNAPWGSSGISSSETGMDGHYWAINRFGTGGFNASITFTVSENLLPAHETDLESISLYRRASHSDATWTFVKHPVAVNAAKDQVTFNEINVVGQYYITARPPFASNVPSVGVPDSGLRLWPNPTQDRVVVEWDGLEDGAGGTAVLRVYNALGQLVYEDGGCSVFPVVLETKDWGRGVYWVRVGVRGGVDGDVGRLVR